MGIFRKTAWAAALLAMGMSGVSAVEIALPEAPAEIAALGDGPAGKTLEFTGKLTRGVRLAGPEFAALSGRKDFTLVVLVRIDEYVNGAGILRKSATLSGVNGWSLTLSTGGIIGFSAGDGKGGRVYLYTGGVPAGKWMELAVTRAGDEFQLLIDGRVGAAGTVTGLNVAGDEFELLAGDSGTYEPFRGAVAGVEYFDHALSAEELAARIRTKRFGVELDRDPGFRIETLGRFTTGEVDIPFVIEPSPGADVPPALAEISPVDGSFTAPLENRDNRSFHLRDARLKPGVYIVTMELRDRFGDLFKREKRAIRVAKRFIDEAAIDGAELAAGDNLLICDPGRFLAELKVAPGKRTELRLPVSGNVAVYAGVAAPNPEVAFDFNKVSGKQDAFAPFFRDEQIRTQEIYLGSGDFSQGGCFFTPAGKPLEIRYLRLIGLSPREMELATYRNNPTANRNVIYNNDGFSDFHGQDEWNAERLYHTVDQLKGSDAGVFELAALVSGAVNFPSRYATYYGEGHLEYDPGYWARRADCRAANFLRRMEAKGLPYFKSLLERTQADGMKFFGSLRMSGYYGPDHLPFNGELWAEHPEYRVKTRSGSTRSEMSYAWPEVRRQRIGVLLEMIEMGADGVSMDFCRYPTVLGYDQPLVDKFTARYGEDPRKLADDDPRWVALRCEELTGFFREVRRAVTEAEKRLGRKITIAARIPVYGTREYGFDVPAIAREKLVDILIPHQPGLEENINYDFSEWVKMVEGTGVSLYPGIEGVYHETGPVELTDAQVAAGVIAGQMITTAGDCYRSKAYDFYRQGADGIFVFNNWSGRNCLNQLGDRRYLEQWNYFANPDRQPFNY